MSTLSTKYSNVIARNEMTKQSAHRAGDCHAYRRIEYESGEYVMHRQPLTSSSNPSFIHSLLLPHTLFYISSLTFIYLFNQDSNFKENAIRYAGTEDIISFST